MALSFHGSAPAQNATTYFSAPALSNLAFNITTPYSDLTTQLADNAYFLTCFRGAAVPVQAPAIYDANGSLMWMSPDWGSSINLDQQTYNGQPVLTLWVGTFESAGYGFGKGVILDSTYTSVKNVTTSFARGADIHEFKIPTDTNSTAILTAYNPIPLDLSPYAGPTDGWLLDSLVQEVDINTGNVLFNWSAFDHIPLNESSAPLASTGTAADNPWDAVHINSVDKDADGNYLVSARHLNQVFKINKDTGDISWRLGGNTTDFEMGNGTAFFWQHDARWHENFTHVSIFDNGASNWVSSEPTARGIYLSLNFSAMTATLVAEYLPTNRNFSQSQGSMRILDNGNVVVGYGSNPWITEHTSNGTVVFSAAMGPASLGDNGPVQNYRTIKTTTWVGRPTSPPTLAAINSSSGLDVYVSWNGATQVATYTLLAGTDAAALGRVASTPRSAFETHMRVAPPPPFVAVAALAHNGTELGRSGVVRVSNGAVVQDGSVADGSAAGASPGSGGAPSNGAAGRRDALWLRTVGGALLLCAAVWRY